MNAEDRRIEAVLFDLDDTLLDGAAAGRAGLDRLLVHWPHIDPAVAFEAWHAASERHYPRYLAGELTFEQSRIERIRSWCDALSIQLEAGAEASWFAAYLVGYEAGWAAFDDVAAALGQLEDLRLGVVTNGEGVDQRAKLTALGLASTFEVTVCSGEVGCAKPDPRIFRHAADLLGLPPERILFVGDRRETDALGAIGAGMAAVWLNRKREAAPDESVPEIASLDQLAALLGSPSWGVSGATASGSTNRRSSASWSGT